MKKQKSVPLSGPGFCQDRRTIRPRQTQPVDGALVTDQRRNLAVADESIRIHVTTVFDFAAKVN